MEIYLRAVCFLSLLFDRRGCSGQIVTDQFAIGSMEAVEAYGARVSLILILYFNNLRRLM